MEQLPRAGQRVKVKTATGEERPVVVTGLGDGVAYVTTEEEFIRAGAEGREPVAFMGFPLEDVHAA